MNNEIAILSCVERYDKEEKRNPKFRLTYKEHVWEFRAVNIGDAGCQARWNLDVLVFGVGEPIWNIDVDKQRIKYTTDY